MAATYYDILGVSNTATPTEIRRAYLKLAVHLHPDKAGLSPSGPPSSLAPAPNFWKIQEAYETLSTPEKRILYDFMGAFVALAGDPFPSSSPPNHVRPSITTTILIHDQPLQPPPKACPLRPSQDQPLPYLPRLAPPSHTSLRGEVCGLRPPSPTHSASSLGLSSFDTSMLLDTGGHGGGSNAGGGGGRPVQRLRSCSPDTASWAGAAGASPDPPPALRAQVSVTAAGAGPPPAIPAAAPEVPSAAGLGRTAPQPQPPAPPAPSATPDPAPATHPTAPAAHAAPPSAIAPRPPSPPSPSPSPEAGPLSAPPRAPHAAGHPMAAASQLLGKRRAPGPHLTAPHGPPPPPGARQPSVRQPVETLDSGCDAAPQSDVRHRLVLTLEELYGGCVKQLRLARRVYRPAAATPAALPYNACSAGGGGGAAATVQEVAGGGGLARLAAWSTEELFRVVVQPGWREGTRVTFPGKGNELPGGSAGDMVLVIAQAAHATFTRRGNDLHTVLPVRLADALYGGREQLATLDGRTVSVEVGPACLAPHSLVVVKGEGMPIPGAAASVRGGDGKGGMGGSAGRGDLVVRFRVVFPEVMTEAQRRELRRALQGNGVTL